MMRKFLKATIAILSFCWCSSACVAQQVYTGHDNTPLLRGANIESTTLGASDMYALGSWGANVVRYQLSYTGPDAANFQGGGSNTDSDISAADRTDYMNWINGEINGKAGYTDLRNMITWCAANNIKVIIDLHVTPGGYIYDGSQRIFVYQQDYKDLLSIWKSMATAFKGNSTVWGYDLCNEPIDGTVGAKTNTLTGGSIVYYKTWNQIYPSVTTTIRSIDNTIYDGFSNDYQHAVIVEGLCPPNNPIQYFPNLVALPGKGVVYSVHDYDPSTYTGQGLSGYPAIGTYAWPYTAGSVTYNSQWLANDLLPVRNWQLKQAAAGHPCQIFVGEFSALRWQMGSQEYLNELISLFESYGWDYTYHSFRGWEGWNPELGTDTNNYLYGPTYTPFTVTDRKTLLTSWFGNDNGYPGNVPQATFQVPLLGLTAWQYDPSGSAWNFQGTAGLASNGSVWANPNAPVGTQVAFLQETGSMTQTVTWNSNTYYTVSYEAAPSPYGQGSQTLQVCVAGYVIPMNIQGTLASSVTVPQSNTGWTTYSTAPFTVNTGNGAVTSPLTLQGTTASITGNTAFVANLVVSSSTGTVSDPNFLNSVAQVPSGSYTYDPTGPAWTFTGTSGVASNGSAWGNPPSPTGTQVAFVYQQSGISQNVTWQPNTTYKLSFQAAPREYLGPQGLQVTVGDVVIPVNVNGTLQNTVTIPQTPSGWTTYTTAPFTVGTGSAPVQRTLNVNGTTTTNTAFITNIVAVGEPVQVRNPNFEFTAPTLSAQSYQYLPAGAEWIFTSGAGISTDDTAWTDYLYMAQPGSQVAFLQHQSSISNTPVGTWDPAAQYTITFTAAPWFWSVSASGGANQGINVSLDSTQLMSVTPSGAETAFASYTTPPFSVSAGSHTITFTGTNADCAAVMNSVAVQVSTPKVR